MKRKEVCPMETTRGAQAGRSTPSAGDEAIHRRFFQAYNEQDLDAVGALLADDFVAHFGAQHLGREAYFQFVGAFFAGFPDLRNTVEEQLAQEDLAASRTVWEGTHRGAFLGVPATGNLVRFEALSLSRIAGGKIAEHWFIGDLLSVLQQLGALPAPGQEGPPSASE